MYTTLFPICLYSEETLTHLFLLFPLAEEVWNNSDLAIHFVDDPLFEFKKWLRDKIIYFRKEDGYNDTRLIHFLDILRAIWTTRNAHVFRHCRATLDVFKENLDQGMHSQATFSFQVVQPQLDNPSIHYPLGFLVAKLGRRSAFWPRGHYPDRWLMGQ